MGAHKQEQIAQLDYPDGAEPEVVQPMRGDGLCELQGWEYSWRERAREEGNQEVDRG